MENCSKFYLFASWKSRLLYKLFKLFSTICHAVMETLLARGYEHLQSLDSGGQANVYKALKNGKPCAIKVTEVKNVDDFGKLDRDLRREVEITSRLKHPNCMAIWEIFRTKSKVYTVMPQCKGSIGALVRKSGPRCEWNAKSWFCDIVRAVRYLHDNRVAHRDLKLDNVLLDDFDNPIVADFGLSTYITYDADGQLQLNRSFCGTRSHQSPQILKKIPYNVYKSDIWALGVMLFILVNQDYPFNRKEGPNVMYAKQMTREYHLRRDIEPKLSTDIKDLISKLLEPDEPKRLDIWAIGQHPFFPVIYQEADLKIDKARKTLGLRR